MSKFKVGQGIVVVWKDSHAKWIVSDAVVVSCGDEMACLAQRHGHFTIPAGEFFFHRMDLCFATADEASAAIAQLQGSLVTKIALPHVIDDGKVTFLSRQGDNRPVAAQLEEELRRLVAGGKP